MATARNLAGRPGGDTAIRVGHLRRNRTSLLGSTALQAAVLLVITLPAQAGPLSPNAQPQNGVVVAGQAVISQSATDTTVRQSSQRAAVDWQSFNVGAAQSVTFQQPSASATTLNRVTGPDPSAIAGRITANGNVVLVNPSGVVFEKGSQVNVNSLVVSTAGMRNDDFMAGKTNFSIPGNPNATVVNSGTITVKDSGLAALVAPAVANHGVINARMGKVVLAGATTHTVDLYGDGLLAIDVTGQVKQVPVGADGQKVTALVTNTGTILAQGGSITLTAAAADGIVTNLVTAGGKISASGGSGPGGSIVLNGVGGSLVVQGEVNARGSTGGSVQALADGGVTVAAAAKIDVSGHNGGGTVALGTTLARAVAGPSTANARTARTVTVAPGAVVKADATGNGNGGTIAVLSSVSTDMAGTLSARGAPQGGHGGFAEVSGNTGYALTGTVDVGAPLGQAGTILLDPTDLTIATLGANSTVNSAGTLDYSALPATATLDPTTLTGLTGNVLLQATNNITVTNPVNAAQATSLTLQAGNNLTVNATVTVALGSLTLSAADPGIPGHTTTGALTVNAGLSAGTGMTLKSGTGPLTVNASLTAPGQTVSLLAGGDITQTGTSGITAGTLTGSAVGTANFSGGTTDSSGVFISANRIVNLGDFTASAVTFYDYAAYNTALTVRGNVTTPGTLPGAVIIGTTGLLTVNAAETVAGNSGVTLVGYAGINLGGAVASRYGDVTLKSGNPIVLDNGASIIATTGNVLLATGAAAGIVIPPALQTAPSIELNGATVTAGGTLSLLAGINNSFIGDITGSGPITARVLTASATGTLSLTDAANAVVTLGNVSAAGGVTFVDGVPLTVRGTVNGSANTTIDTGAQPLTISSTAVVTGTTSVRLAGTGVTISGTVNDGGAVPGTGTVTLISLGGIDESQGILIAGTLTGSAATDARLTGTNYGTISSAPLWSNQIGTLVNFAAGGDFVLHSGGDGVSVSGIVTAGTAAATGAFTSPNTLEIQTTGLLAVTGSLTSGTAGASYRGGTVVLKAFDATGGSPSSGNVLIDSNSSLTGTVTSVPNGAGGRDSIAITAPTIEVYGSLVAGSDVSNGVAGLITLQGDAIIIASPGTVSVPNGLVGIAPLTRAGLTVDQGPSASTLLLTPSTLGQIDVHSTATASVAGRGELALGSLDGTTASAGTVTLNVPVSLPQVSTIGLFSTGDITQAAGAVLTATNLVGRAGTDSAPGTITLVAANNIGTIGLAGTAWQPAGVAAFDGLVASGNIVLANTPDLHIVGTTGLVSGVGTAVPAASLTLTDGNALLVDGPLGNCGTGSLTLSAYNIAIGGTTAPTVWSFGPATLGATTDVTVTSGVLNAYGIDVTSGTLVQSGGTIASFGTMSVAGSFLQSGGTAIVNDALSFSGAGSTLDTGGTLAVGSLNLQGVTVVNTGLITATGDLNFAQITTNTGAIVTGGDVNLTSLTQTTGTIAAGGSITVGSGTGTAGTASGIASSGSFSQSGGAVLANGDITIWSPDAVTQSGGTLAAGGTLAITAASLAQGMGGTGRAWLVGGSAVRLYATSGDAQQGDHGTVTGPGELANGNGIAIQAPNGANTFSQFSIPSYVLIAGASIPYTFVCSDQCTGVSGAIRVGTRVEITAGLNPGGGGPHPADVLLLGKTVDLFGNATLAAETSGPVLHARTLWLFSLGDTVEKSDLALPVSSNPTIYATTVIGNAGFLANPALPGGLQAPGTWTQTANSNATLGTVSAGGTISNPNLIETLGPYATTGTLSVTNASTGLALTVAGATAGTAVTITSPDITVSGPVTAPAVTLTANTGTLGIISGGTVDAGTALLMGQNGILGGSGLVIGNGALTASSANGQVDLTNPSNVVASVAGSAATNFGLNDSVKLTIAGDIAAPAIQIGAVTALTVANGVTITTGFEQLPAVPASQAPPDSNGSTGLNLAILNGSGTIDLGSGLTIQGSSGPNATVRLALTGGGLVNFGSFNAPGADLLLHVGSGAAAGNINVRNLSAFYQAGFLGPIDLTGTVGGQGGAAAAAVSRIGQEPAPPAAFAATTDASFVPGPTFQVNGCPISVLNCGITPPPPPPPALGATPTRLLILPVIPPYLVDAASLLRLRERRFVLAVPDSDLDDPDLLLPYISDRDN